MLLGQNGESTVIFNNKKWFWYENIKRHYLNHSFKRLKAH